MRFTFANGDPVVSDQGKSSGNSIKWMDSRVLSVNDTTSASKLVAELVKMTPKGQTDEVIATGVVDMTKLQQIFKQVPEAVKPFRV